MLELFNVNKRIDDFELRNLYLKIEKGDYFVLLGNSGSGKSLLLELITGFIKPDSGKILLNNQDVTKLSVQKRTVGIVFDDFAIFPHLTVRENIEFPLHETKLSRKLIQNKVAEYAGMVGIAHLLTRMPRTLSHGELQRLAIARTLASEPELLCLDQPLSALDIKLKGEIRRLLRTLNQKGYTIIHVTQEYEEAIALANKVAILDKGRIIQEGVMEEVFSKPRTEFIANFIGINNYFPAQLISNRISDYKKAIISENFEIIIETDKENGVGFVLIRDENVLLSEIKQQSYRRNNFRGRVIEISRLKHGNEVILDIGVNICVAVSDSTCEALQLVEEKTLWVSFRADDAFFVKV